MKENGSEVAGLQRQERWHCRKAMSNSFATLSQNNDDMGVKKNGGLRGIRNFKNAIVFSSNKAPTAARSVA